MKKNINLWKKNINLWKKKYKSLEEKYEYLKEKYDRDVEYYKEKIKIKNYDIDLLNKNFISLTYFINILFKYEKNKFKTLLCEKTMTFDIKGKPNYHYKKCDNENCNFAHGISELRNKYKFFFCRELNCNRKGCTFSHSVSEWKEHNNINDLHFFIRKNSNKKRKFISLS